MLIIASVDECLADLDGKNQVHSGDDAADGAQPTRRRITLLQSARVSETASRPFGLSTTWTVTRSPSPRAGTPERSNAEA